MPKPRGPKYPVESRGPSYSRYLTKLRVRRHWTTRVKTHWKTRTTGSASQLGKPFPVMQKMQLPPKIRAPPPRPSGVVKRFPGELVGRKPAKLLAYVVREGRQFMKLGPFESKVEASAKLFREKRNSPEAFAEKQGKQWFVMSPQTRAGGAAPRDIHGMRGRIRRESDEAAAARGEDRSRATYMKLLESRGGKVEHQRNPERQRGIMEELSGLHYRAGERPYGGKAKGRRLP